MVTYEMIVEEVNNIIEEFYILMDGLGGDYSSLEEAEEALAELRVLQEYEDTLLSDQTKLDYMKNKLTELINLLKKCRDDYNKVKSKTYYDEQLKKCGIFKDIDRVHLLLSNIMDEVDKIKNNKIPNLISKCESKISEIDDLLKRIRICIIAYNAKLDNAYFWIDYYNKEGR